MKLVIFLICFFVSVESVLWKSCGSGSETPVKKLEVSGCETTKVCTLIKGQTYTIKITFNADRNITAATMKVYGVIEHVSLPFPLDNPNACLNSGIKCPMSQGAGYEYQSHIFVKEVYPSLTLFIKWDLLDQNSKEEFCVIFKAVLKSKTLAEIQEI